MTFRFLQIFIPLFGNRQNLVNQFLKSFILQSIFDCELMICFIK